MDYVGSTNSQKVSRLWIGIRLGKEHQEIKDECVQSFITNLRNCLADEGVELSRKPLFEYFSTNSFEEVCNAVNKVLLASKGIQPPILFLLIDDVKPSKNDLVEKYADYLFIFSITGEELQAMIYHNDFTKVKYWCREFAREWIIPGEISYPTNSRSSNDHAIKNSFVNAEEIPSLSLIPETSSSFINQDYNDTEEYNSQKVVLENGYNNPNYQENQYDRSSNMEENIYIVKEEGTAILRYAVVHDALEEFHRCNIEKKGGFIHLIAGNLLFERFSSPFNKLSENQELLKLLVSVMEAVNTDEGIEILNEVLAQIIKEKFIEKICDQIMVQGNVTSIETLRYLLKIFENAFDNVPPEHHKNFDEPWIAFIEVLDHAPSQMWEEYPNAKDWFESVIFRLRGGHSSMACTQPTIMESMFYDKYEQIEPLWISSEKIEPPTDFRKLCCYPTNKDIIEPEIPYLRRSIINGPYKNAEHYLDIQFRLFREDLVSPLRDGIYTYQVTGTHRYNRIIKKEAIDTSTSDIIICDVLSVGGLQASLNKGESLHYIQLENNSFLINAINRHLKYGQLIALSSDDFKKNVHIGVITERHENELISNGLLGIRFLTDSIFDPKKKYKLVEPNSYLEMYIHVLKVMQNMKKLEQIPMERYLVQLKTTKRLPRYLRKDDGCDAEDKELESYYQNLKHKQQVDLRQKKAKEGFYSSDDEDDYPLNADTKRPISRKIADENQKSKLKIDGIYYNIENLEEELPIDDYDPSQRRALINALTNEMALIQGPPGTGKTFIGVEIVRVILENRIRLGITVPVLLVCYTNSALDQFLEKILDKIEEDQREQRYSHHGPVAVRLGTKSDSLQLERRGVMRKSVISEWKSELAPEEDRETGKYFKRRGKEASKLAAAAYIVSDDAVKEIFSYEELARVISSHAKEEFLSWNIGKQDSKQEPLVMDEVLACWLLDKTIESSSIGSLPPDSDEEEIRKCSSSPNHIGLDQALHNLNLRSEEQRALDEKQWDSKDEFEKLYETSMRWDIVKQDDSQRKKTLIFGDGGMKTLPSSRGNLQRTAHDSSIVQQLLENKENILQTVPLSEEEVVNIRSIYGLPKQRRWQLYSHWSIKLREYYKQQIPLLIKNYQTECTNLQEALEDVDVKVLQRSLIIGATTTGAAKMRGLLEKCECKILIIEEAGEVLEAHTFGSLLSSIDHVILIGDHQQLRPNPSVFELARSYSMDISLFERLIKNGIHFETLETQHRMHPDITKSIVRPYFYNMLKDADNVSEYPEVIGLANRLFFWCHDEDETMGHDGVSYSNQKEQLMIMALLEHLFKQGYSHSEITVIATYSAQVDDLKQHILSKYGLSTDCKTAAISVETVDSFQGKENKIIIVSLIRSKGPTIGFLSIANRICVALTRAKHGMFIVGNAEHLAAKCSLWGNIYQNLQNFGFVDNSLPIKCRPHGKVQFIEELSEFATKSPDGGCTQQCGYLLTCKHLCSRRCHPVDDHHIYQCKEICKRECNNRNYNHPCIKWCFEDCGLCQEIVPALLKCGHTVNVACHMINRATCDKPCENILPCNHPCQETCSQPCTKRCNYDVCKDFPCGHALIIACHSLFKDLQCTSKCEEVLSCGHRCQEACKDICTLDCKEIVVKTLDCGHTKELECYKNPSTQKCLVGVQSTLSCSHTCEVPCYCGTSREACTIPCNTTLPCGHICIGTCGKCWSTKKHRCPEPCRKYLSCGHKCTKTCGEKCGECESSCLTSCYHAACGLNNNNTPGITFFARSCAQQCVLCVKNCSNSCPHRACGKKCFEVCNVQPCEENCMRQLPCGHACLGMCSEYICPELCGTCQKGRYVQLLGQYNLNPDRFYNLIQIPSCQHIFPVEVLDNFMLTFENGKKRPHCPLSFCQAPIYKVKRYSQILNKFVLNAYNEKEIIRNQNNVRNFEQCKNELNFSYWSLKIKENKQKTRNPCGDLRLYYDKILSGVKNDNNDGKTHKYAMWIDLLRCMKTFCDLLGYVKDSNDSLPKFIRNSPYFHEWFQLVFDKSRGLISEAVHEEFENCWLEIKNAYAIQLSGAFLPVLRYKLCQLLYSVTIWKFYAIVKNQFKEQDISKEQMRILKANTVSFKQCTTFEDFYNTFVNLLNYINFKILEPLRISPIVLDKYTIPPF